MESRSGAGARPTVRRLRDVKVIKGVRLSRFHGSGHDVVVDVQAHAEGQSHPEGSEGPLVATLRVDGVVSYRAVIDVSDETILTSAPTRAVPVLAPTSFSAPLYNSPTRGGLLFHGKSFQLIEHVDGANAAAMAARVSTTSAARWTGQFILDPAALDAGLQLVLLWARQQCGGAFLPTGIGALHVYGGQPAHGSLTCIVDGKGEVGLSARADVAFVDDQGQLVFEMTDVQTHRLPDDRAFSSAEPLINAPAGAAE